MSANFTLKTLADKLTADRCTHRFLTLQRTGKYAEMRIITRPGGKTFRIVGYQWPDRKTRRRYGIGKKNPTIAAATPNQVYFQQRGRNLVGWIDKETPTRYRLTYKSGATTRTVWRLKKEVMFAATGRKNPTGPCTVTENPRNAIALDQAIELSARFHGFAPRSVKKKRFDWPDAVVLIGACAQVDYVTDKFDNRTRQYFHEFGPDTEIYASPDAQADGSRLLIIRGKFKITKRGIEG